MRWTYLKPKTAEEIKQTFQEKYNIPWREMDDFMSKWDRRKFLPSNKVIFIIWSATWLIFAASLIISVIVAANNGSLWYPFEGGYKVDLSASFGMIKLIINSFFSICQFAIPLTLGGIVINKMVAYDWD